MSLNDRTDLHSHFDSLPVSTFRVRIDLIASDTTEGQQDAPSGAWQIKPTTGTQPVGAAGRAYRRRPAFHWTMEQTSFEYPLSLLAASKPVTAKQYCCPLSRPEMV